LSSFLYSQLEPPWRTIPLGKGGNETIGTAGCLLTKMATIASLNDFQITPGELNRIACREGYFTGGNRLYFSLLELFGLNVEVIDCFQNPAPVDRIDGALKCGGYALAQVDFVPRTRSIQEHWVRIAYLESSNDYVVDDPWTGRETSLMARYAHYAWPDPSRAIYRLALYFPSDQGKSFDPLADSYREQQYHITSKEAYLE